MLGGTRGSRVITWLTGAVVEPGWTLCCLFDEQVLCRIGADGENLTKFLEAPREVAISLSRLMADNCAVTVGDAPDTPRLWRLAPM